MYNQLEKNKYRERYIDIVKGLSILCITFLHYEQGLLPSTVNVFIGSFMITSFYVTSGWVSAMNPSKRTMKELIQKRWKQLGIPYFWWTLIILTFDFILLLVGYCDFKFIGYEIYKTITLRGIGTLWFLPALFGGEIVWNWLRRQNKISVVLLIFATTFLYQYLYTEFFAGKTETIYRIVNAPFKTVSSIMTAWVGIAFGYYAYMALKDNILKSSKLILGFCGLIFCVIAFITANFLPSCLYMFWSFFAPLFGPLGFLLLAKSLQQFKLLNYLNYWGVNSLNLMVTHYSITMVLFKIIVEKGFNQSMYGWTSIICFILSMPIQHLLVISIDKYAKKILGK